MTISLKAIAAMGAAAVTLSACETMMMTDTSMSDGQDFAALQMEFPDLSAQEFAVLDSNNDGIVDSQERMRIEMVNAPGVLDPITVDDN